MLLRKGWFLYVMLVVNLTGIIISFPFHNLFTRFACALALLVLAPYLGRHHEARKAAKVERR